MLDRYHCVRRQTLSLIDGLTAEDCCAQSMTEASPAKWHLAHTTWFFETFVLSAFEQHFKPLQPQYKTLFNSYYETVGPKHPRNERGLMTRPSLNEILTYRAQVDERMDHLLASSKIENQELISLVEWGLQHEQQHQELILSDIKHLFHRNPLKPAYRSLDPSIELMPKQKSPSQEQPWLSHPGGLINVGARGDYFFFDNESPRHSHWLEPFKLSPHLVTNQEFLEFIQDGGYQNPLLWLSEGWGECERLGLCHPLYWEPTNDGWIEFTLHGNQVLKPEGPLLHVSYFEAEAFARWAGYRLPSEFEWESLTQIKSMEPTQSLEPPPDNITLHPGAKNNSEFSGFFRVGWQWTQSSYAPYPGYKPIEGALGEYNGKFMVNQQVLRGGACVTPFSHIRTSYRNFYPAASRWAFSSIRLAMSI